MTGWPEGTGRLIFDEIDSTNAEARRRAEAGVTGPIWILARRQLAGRGRLGRSWVSPEGNLSASYLRRFDGTAQDAATRFVQAMGIAVADLCAEAAPEAAITLKWPNDVLANGSKVAGILIENLGVCHAGGGIAVVAGAGVNLSHAPAPGETRWPATSLADEGARPPGPEDALDRLAAALPGWLLAPRPALLAAWRARLHGLGEPIEARLPDRRLEGIFDDVDEDGALVLRTAAGRRRVMAADVFFPR